MLKNYYEINENETISNFLKLTKEKKNFQYIILEDNTGFVDIRTIALRLSNINEKLKGLKKPLTISKTDEPEDNLKKLIESGDRVIATKSDYFDFIDGLKYILEQDYEFLRDKIKNIQKKEVFALDKKDKISTARNLMLKQRVNMLPVISGMEVIGEIRPNDFLANELFLPETRKGEYYKESYSQPVFNMSVDNIMNHKPHTIDSESTIKETLKLMVEKKLPSIIITEKGELYSIISHRDLFRLVKEDQKEVVYTIEFLGSDTLYDDEFDLVQDYAEKTMEKIFKMSDYNKLKMTFKSVGNNDESHKRKYELKLLLSEGNKVIQLEKETLTGTHDEEFNDKVKDKRNVLLMVQEALSNLEKKVKEEKDRKK